jgi:hypothetical protein
MSSGPSRITLNGGSGIFACPGNDKPATASATNEPYEIFDTASKTSGAESLAVKMNLAER